MKKDLPETFVQRVVGDEDVRRACADFLIAIVGAFIGKRGATAKDEDQTNQATSHGPDCTTRGIGAVHVRGHS